MNNTSDTGAFNDKILSDYKQMEEMTGRKIISQLVDLFEKSYPLKVTEAAKHVESDNMKAASEIFHSLKSSCGNLGLMMQFHICAELELSLLKDTFDTAKKDQIRQQIKILQDQFNPSLQFLNQWRS